MSSPAIEWFAKASPEERKDFVHHAIAHLNSEDPMFIKSVETWEAGACILYTVPMTPPGATPFRSHLGIFVCPDAEGWSNAQFGLHNALREMSRPGFDLPFREIGSSVIPPGDRAWVGDMGQIEGVHLGYFLVGDRDGIMITYGLSMNDMLPDFRFIQGPDEVRDNKK